MNNCINTNLKDLQVLRLPNLQMFGVKFTLEYAE